MFNSTAVDRADEDAPEFDRRAHFQAVNVAAEVQREQMLLLEEMS